MISVIHNVYSRNEFIRESIVLNIKALKESKLDFQYIVFNDNGDKAIEEDIADVITPEVQYHYSDINYGMGICSGGWVGAIPLLQGDLVHNIGQDDVYTAAFYLGLNALLQNPNTYLAYSNGIKVNSLLEATNQLLTPLQETDYSNPRANFNEWFGVRNNIPTRTNNYIPAPGVIYKKTLHDKIGPPDLKTFKGSADFEYWARVLFHNLGVKHHSTPTWLYRLSEYSLGSKPEADAKIVTWNTLILQKYQKWLMQ